jgi:hypothetical protein
MSNWYKWTSLELFNAWHEAIKTELGLPKQSVTIDGSEVIGGVVTDKYTNAIVVADDDIRAVVEALYADALTPSQDPYRTNYETLAE